MKKFRLSIGDRYQSFGYEEEDTKVKVLEPIYFPTPESEEALVKKALERPIDSAPLSELVKSGDRVCIIFSDITRLWVRHHVFMPFILDELNRGGVKDIYAVCGNGDHRDHTEEEFKKLLGERSYDRLKGRIYGHHARDPEELVSLGKTTFGTPVKINKKVAEADKVILTGGIVYHFLDGWSGGKKSIMPGVSSRESIFTNHSLALRPEEGKGLDPAVSAGIMRGNRVSDDAVEVASFVNPTFLLNVVLTPERIGAVVAGNYITAHREGAKICEKYYGAQIDRLADLSIVSCGGYPADINFYQTYKTLYNAERATRPGGIIILLSESREGMGNEDFYHMFIDYKNNSEREKALREKYTIGGHMAFHDALMAEKFTIFVVSSLPDRQVEQAGMLPVKTVEEAMDRAQKPHPFTYIIPHGHDVFPYLKEYG